MKKIIVTGGSGFIGSNLVDFLIKKKFFVINLDKLTYSSNKYQNGLRDKKKYKLIKVDIINKKRIIEIIKKYKPKVIFNLAAETHVDRSIDDPSNFIHTNINGTFKLLESLRFLQNKKMFKEFRWKPKIKFEEGLKETINWYFQHRKFLKNISKEKYEKRLGLNE